MAIKQHGLAALLSVAGAVGPASVAPPPAREPTISIRATDDQQWMATYRLHKPATSLVFARSPDASRTQTWTPPRDFEIVSIADVETVRRKDGRPFRAVRVRMRPAYRDLPKDYGPFAPFGDGSMLFHTGRFFACAAACTDDPRWRMSLRTRRDRSIVLNGQIERGVARWRDQDDGSYVYIGDTRPVRRAGVLAIVDQSLPQTVAAQLDRDLPRFGAFYAARLGALPSPPVLFASFDSKYADGWGRQGGALPGQVFTHFYGERWSSEMSKPDFAFDLSWHFAHETGHLYQHGLSSADKSGSWIHEGAAEAFATIAMRDLDPDTAPQIDARIALARRTCAEATERQSLAEALDKGNYRAAYSCGLVLNLAIDQAIRRSGAGQDGLFTVWRRLHTDQRGGQGVTAQDYAAAVKAVAGPCVSEALVRTTQTAGVSLDHEIDRCV